jgi:hypothetical protein
MLKTSYRKKINPEKSNKMIWAVVIGLLVVAIVISFSLFSPKATPHDAVLGAIDYLEHTRGILKLDVSADGARITITYDSLEQNDYGTMAHYAAVRASAKIAEAELMMAENKPEHVVYRVNIHGGLITAEEDLRPPKKEEKK